MTRSISVVIPVFNEEENIIPLYREVFSVLKKLKADFEIIFVNDGSRDGSLKRMLLLQAKNTKVKVIDFYKNFGQSAAMKAGFDLASKALVCYIDGDQQVNFNELPLFLKEIDAGADAVIGWRKEMKGAFFKGFISKVAQKVRRLFLGGQLHDYGCPFKLFKRECLDELELYGEMHRYIPPMLRWRGYKVVEIEITHNSRMRGKTKYNFWRIPKGFLDMIVIWFWLKYSNRPLHIFGGLGMASISLGIIIWIILIPLRLLGKISLVNSILPLFAVLLLLAGIIFFCFGIIADMQMKIYYKVNNKKNYLIKKVYK